MCLLNFLGGTIFCCVVLRMAGQLVGPALGPDWNIVTTIGRIATTFSINIHGSLRMNPNNVGDSLTFHLAPSVWWHFWFKVNNSLIFSPTRLRQYYDNSWIPDFSSALSSGFMTLFNAPCNLCYKKCWFTISICFCFSVIASLAPMHKKEVISHSFSLTHCALHHTERIEWDKETEKGRKLNFTSFLISSNLSEQIYYCLLFRKALIVSRRANYCII